MTLPAAALLVALCSLASIHSAAAAECSMDELQTVQQLSEDIVTSSACSNVGGLDTGTADFNVLCSDSSCLTLLASVTSELPDCEVSGFNFKETFDSIRLFCDGSTAASASSGLAASSASASEAGSSLSSSAAASDSNSTSTTDSDLSSSTTDSDLASSASPASPATTDSSSTTDASFGATDCTSSELDQLLATEQKIYSSSACADITTDAMTATKEDVCESACMDFLLDITSEFPNCKYFGVNLRETYTELLAMCGMSGDGDNAAAGATGGAMIVGVAVAAALALIVQ